jgi:hypothetical protein
MTHEMLEFCFIRKALGVDHPVIHVAQESARFDFWAELCIVHGLERGRRISHSEEHDKRLEQPFRGEEGGFPFVPLSYSDIVVPPSDVELSKEGASCQSVDNLGNERRDVSIADSPFIEGPIVLDGAQLAILFLYKEEVGCIRASRLLNGSTLQVFFYEFVTFLNLLLGERKESSRKGRGGSW